MRAGAVAMALLVGADGKLRDVAGHGSLGHVEADMTTAGPALFGRDQRQVYSIRHEVCAQQKAILLALV